MLFQVLLLLIAETGCNFWALLAVRKQFPLKESIIAPGKILNSNFINQWGEAFSLLLKRVGRGWRGMGSRLKLETFSFYLTASFPPDSRVWSLTFLIRDPKSHVIFDEEKRELMKEFRYQTPGSESAMKNFSGRYLDWSIIHSLIPEIF